MSSIQNSKTIKKGVSQCKINRVKEVVKSKVVTKNKFGMNPIAMLSLPMMELTCPLNSVESLQLARECKQEYFEIQYELITLCWISVL